MTPIKRRLLLRRHVVSNSYEMIWAKVAFRSQYLTKKLFFWIDTRRIGLIKNRLLRISVASTNEKAPLRRNRIMLTINNKRRLFNHQYIARKSCKDYCISLPKKFEMTISKHLKNLHDCYLKFLIRISFKLSESLI